MSNALTGWDTEVKLHNGTALTALAEVFAVTVPDAQADEVDVTHYQSPGRSREFIAGMIDHGELEIQMNYVPGSATDLLLTDAKTEGDVRTWEIIIPNGTAGWKFAGSGFIKSYTKEIPIDDKMTATAVLRVSGAVTEAAVS
jgi:predicted secreted protein